MLARTSLAAAVVTLPLAVLAAPAHAAASPCATNAGKSVLPIVVTTACLTNEIDAYYAVGTAVFPAPTAVTVNGGVPTGCTMYTEIVVGSARSTGQADCLPQAIAGGPVAGTATRFCFPGQRGTADVYVRLTLDNGTTVYVGDSGSTNLVGCTQ